MKCKIQDKVNRKERERERREGGADKQIIQQHTLKKMRTTVKKEREREGKGREAQANKYRKNFLITFFGLICCENNFAWAVWTARYRSVVQRISYSPPSTRQAHRSTATHSVCHM